MFQGGNIDEMHITARMEMLSDAYLQALSASAGCVMSKPRPDILKIDWRLNKPSTYIGLDVQLKSTTNARIIQGDIVYELDVLTYEKLRGYRRTLPGILAVMIVPEDIDDWLESSENELVMRRCLYWRFLGDEPPTKNETTIAIHIPRENILTSIWLDNIFEMLENQGGVNGLF